MLKSDSPAKLTVGTLGTVGTVGTHEPLLTVGLKTQDGGEERNGGMDSADSISTCRSWNYNKNTTKGGGPKESSSDNAECFDLFCIFSIIMDQVKSRRYSGTFLHSLSPNPRRTCCASFRFVSLQISRNVLRS